MKKDSQNIKTYYNPPEPKRHAARREQNRQLKEKAKNPQNIKTYYSAARPMSEAPTHHIERRAQNVELREKSLGPTGRIAKHLAPVGGFIRGAAQEFHSVFGEPPRSSQGALINMPPPSYYGGIPNYFEQPRRPPSPPRQAKRKRRAVEYEPEPESPWEAMSQMPAHARQWWM